MKVTIRVVEHTLALTLLAFAFFALVTLPSQVDAQRKPQRVTPSPSPQPSNTPTPLTDGAIPLPEIVTRADALDVLLGEMAVRLTPDPSLDSLDQTLRSHEESSRARQGAAEAIFASNADILELRDLETDWEVLRGQYAIWVKSLEERSKGVAADLSSLASQQTQWEATRNHIQSANTINAVADRIQDALTRIQATRSKADDLLRLLVTLQNRVSKQDQVVVDVLKRLEQAKGKLQGSIFEAREIPLWEASARRISDQSLDNSLQRAFDRHLTRSLEFLRSRRRGLLMFLALFLVSLAITVAVRRGIGGRVEKQPILEESAGIFQHPPTLALLTTLIVVLPFARSFPLLIKTLVQVLFVIPTLRFLPYLINPAFRPLLYLLVAFGLSEAATEMFGGSESVKREISAALCAIAVALGVWFSRPTRIREMYPASWNGFRSMFQIWCVWAVLALIAASLTANVFGYVALSGVLRAGAVQGSFLAVALYTAFISTTSFYSLFWRSDEAALLTVVRTHGESAAKWSTRLLALVAFGIWLYGTLNLFAVREPILSAFTSALNAPIAVRAAHFTLGDVLTFVLILVFGVILANITRFVLYRDVLVRLSLKQGLPYAISTITYYVLVLIGAFFALASAGVELSRFAILTGAFGVGMGFGLQNIINNFVSGLILLFERPIRMGDFLEVGLSSGWVERIGTRSTSIRTQRGAEVIVPNSNLISNQVINWTLNERWQRSELPIEVPYGNEPERVLKLLVEAAASHPDVLPDPQPSAIFLGFANRALGFELRFWVPSPRMHEQLRSEVALKVAAALRDAGIELGVPPPPPPPLPEVKIETSRGDRDVHPIAPAARDSDEIPDKKKVKEGSGRVK